MANIKSIGGNPIVLSTVGIEDGAVTDPKLADAVRKGYVRSFETVADMQASTTLKAGMTCHTNGFHSAGDGGSAYYTVSADNSGIDGFTVLTAQDDLYCHLMDIAISGYIDLRWTGAHADYDGSANYTDNAPYFAKAFQYIAEHESTPIKIVGRFGIKTQVNAGFALQMFGEYRPSRELVASDDYDLNPISEIHVAADITAFSLTGSGASSTFSYVNLDNIKFTGSGRTSTLIDAPTFGAPSRPNWIRGCEGSSFDNIFKTVGTSAHGTYGTSFFCFDISSCNFYANNYVIYADSLNSTQQTIGNLSISSSVMEQGGGQLYIKNSFGSVSITNSLIEGNNGTMTLHGAITKFLLAGNYFEGNTLTINISGGTLRSSTLLANNVYVSAGTTINILSSEATVLDKATGNGGVIINARRQSVPFHNSDNDTIASTSTWSLHSWRTLPSIVSPVGTQEIVGSVTTDTKMGLYHRTWENTTGLAAGTSEAGGYVVFSLYAFTSTTIGLYDVADSGIYTGIALTAGLNVLVFKTTNAIRPRVRATGEISNVLVSYVSAADAANFKPIDFAVCANKAA